MSERRLVQKIKQEQEKDEKAPEIKVEDVAMFDAAYIFSESLKHGDIRRQMENSIKRDLKRLINRRRKKVKLKKKFLKIFPGKSEFYYHVTGIDALEDKLYKIVKKYVPPNIAKLNWESSARQICKPIEDMMRENQLFINYFFSMVVSRSFGEKEWYEIVPVEKSFSFFGLISSKNYEPFRKEGKVTIKGETQNTELLGTVLTPKLIDPFINRILRHANEFNKTLELAVSELRLYGAEPIEPDEYLVSDIAILNHDLKNLGDRSYRREDRQFDPITGLYAVQLNTALRRIYERLKQDVEKIEETVRYVLHNLPHHHYDGRAKDWFRNLGYTTSHLNNDEKILRKKIPEK